MNIGSLIDVFRMVEISEKTRANIIIQLGRAFNNTICMNITEPIVYELVNILDPTNGIFLDEYFIKSAGKSGRK